MTSRNASRALEGFFDVASLLGDAMQRELGARGLTPARAEVIWRLGRDGPMTQRDLSRALRCTPRNVTGLLDALQGTGLVVRRPHPDDRRATLVNLTARGLRARTTWAKGYEKLAGGLFAGIDSRALASFVRTLDVVRERLRRTRIAPRSRRSSARTPSSLAPSPTCG